MDKFTIVVATDANMDMAKILIKNPGKAGLILDNFNSNGNPCGVATFFVEDGNLVADIVLRPDLPDVYLDRWPAVGGQFIKSETSNYCISGIIYHLSLCSYPNVDKNIKTLRDQLQICLVPVSKIISPCQN